MATSTPKEIENQALINQVYKEVWTNRDLSILDEIVTEDMTYHGPSMELHNKEEFKMLINNFFTAFDETKLTVTNQFAKDEMVVSRFIFEGIHSGDLQGIPPTGKKVKLSGIEINTFEKGKLVESWEEFDQLGMMKQLGLKMRPMEVAH